MFLFLTIVAYAGIYDSPIFSNLLSAYGDLICVAHDQGISCRGSYTYDPVELPVRNPISVSVGQNKICALDENGAHCWTWDPNWYDGLKYKKETPIEDWAIPQLKSPKQISVGKEDVCALDQDGVRCWNWFTKLETDLPPLRHPKMVSSGETHACALDEDGVKCWGDNSLGQTTVPALSHPWQVSAEDGYTCALDDSGVVCWGYYPFREVPYYIHEPTYLGAGRGSQCAIYPKGYECWGSGGYKDFRVVLGRMDRFDHAELAITTVSGGPDNSYSWNEIYFLTKEGLLCSRQGPYCGFRQPFQFERLLSGLQLPLEHHLAKYYHQLSQHSPLPVAKLFTMAQKFAENEFVYSERNRSTEVAAYLHLQLVKPAIQSRDSVYFRDKVIPAYEKSIHSIEEELGLSGIQGISRRGSLNRKVALSVLLSTVTGMNDFLSPERRGTLVLRALGQAIQEPENDSKLALVLQEIERFAPVFSGLSANPRCAFLVETATKAMNWLKEHL